MVTFPGSRTPATCGAASTGHLLRLPERNLVDGATARESDRTCRDEGSAGAALDLSG